jgi:hypothetical protein
VRQTPDQRSRSASPRAPSSPRLELAAKPILIGHSFGGMIAEKLLGMEHTVPEAIANSALKQYRHSAAVTEL